MNERGDDNFQRYVGFRQNNPCIRKYFSPDTVRAISSKVTQLLDGVHPRNRPIMVPDSTICSVMSAIFDGYVPETGDIYGRYNVPTDRTQSMVAIMIDRVIETITSQIRTEYGTLATNSRLTAWTTVLGDFNSEGLRSHSVIKVRRRRPAPMQFNMNY